MTTAVHVRCWNRLGAALRCGAFAALLCVGVATRGGACLAAEQPVRAGASFALACTQGDMIEAGAESSPAVAEITLDGAERPRAAKVTNADAAAPSGKRAGIEGTATATPACPSRPAAKLVVTPAMEQIAALARSSSGGNAGACGQETDVRLARAPAVTEQTLPVVEQTRETEVEADGTEVAARAAASAEETKPQPEQAATQAPGWSDTARIVREVRIPSELGGIQSLPGGRVAEDADYLLDRRIEQLKAQTRPELVQRRTVRMSAEERVELDTTALSVPLNDRWTLGWVGTLERFELDPATDENDQKARSIRGRLRAERRMSESLSLFGDFLPYTGENTRGVGGNFGAAWIGPKRVSVMAQLHGNAPWTDNTLIVRHNGRHSGGDLAVRVPLTERFSFSGQSTALWYAAGTDPGGQAGWMARGYTWSGRLDAALWRQEERSMGGGFLEPGLTYEDAIGSELVAYGAYDVRRTEQYEEYDAFATTPRAEETRVGLEGAFALSDRLGVRGGGFVGQDVERDMAWNTLYGWNARLVFQPTKQLRLWGEYETISESSTGLNDGKSRSISMGMNIQF